MADEALYGYMALYARLDSLDQASAVAQDRRNADLSLMAVRIAPPDPAGFKAALDLLIPKVQAAFNAARTAHDFDLADQIESVLSRLYWRIYARDELIAALDQASAAAMTALQDATATLQRTAADFDQGDDDTDTAMTSLQDLAEAVGLKS
jgi:hypothetical protein